MERNRGNRAIRAISFRLHSRKRNNRIREGGEIPQRTTYIHLSPHSTHSLTHDRQRVRNCFMGVRPSDSYEPSGLGADILALKYDSRILGHCNNPAPLLGPVCGCGISSRSKLKYWLGNEKKRSAGLLQCPRILLT